MFVLLIILLAGCSRQKAYTTDFFDYFDTYSSLTVCAGSPEEAERYAGLTRALFEQYDALLDSFESHPGYVNLFDLNQAAGSGPVAVSRELYDFIAYGLDVYEITGHTVNIALGPVLQLWQQALNDEAHPLPDDEALRQAALHTDPGDVILNEKDCTVELRSADMALDAGALAKGYVAALVEEALRGAGCKSALLSAGGNILCIGNAPEGGDWRIGIRNPDYPDHSSTSIAQVLTVQDVSVVTSGDYERFFEKDGVRYHHLIDPETLYPGHLYRSVTIVCRDGAAADMLSTALFLMPRAEGEALAARYDAQVIYMEGGMS